MVRKKVAMQSAFFPDGRLGFAVGDIHGRADLLAKMLDRLELEAAKTPDLSPLVIFLGDYIDRGLQSRKVVDLLLSGRPEGFELRFLRGNHEQAMQQFLDNPGEARAWLAFGGMETLAAYGVRPPSPDAPEEALKAASEALGRTIPPEHLNFFNGLERSASMGDYFFAHAGVNPEKSAEDQTDHDLYWIRDRFLSSSRPWEKVVVHGHTPAQEAYRDHRRIGVDTGAYATGRLTAARFEANHVAFITV